ncbi:hypothetical protein AVEN_268318-1 [Araneus ventricosus]|uniref:Uncharacterized protein n=1 Tax=Araneus ventricosus TaxID=182803 RepID=A0A4Y2CSJ4_ARAVE|nr:hypothetical protein AVEN_264047-1 [Araneus ventricosus]GBM07342.1 hypothetical protein AVEN_268318-1 [Araneus ventricosus]
MKRTTPELFIPFRIFRFTPAEERMANAFDLRCNIPHTLRIFSRNWMLIWNAPVPEQRPYHLATTALYHEAFVVPEIECPMDVPKNLSPENIVYTLVPVRTHRGPRLRKAIVKPIVCHLNSLADCIEMQTKN